jgi:hypothetical protein
MNLLNDKDTENRLDWQVLNLYVYDANIRVKLDEIYRLIKEYTLMNPISTDLLNYIKDLKHNELNLHGKDSVLMHIKPELYDFAKENILDKDTDKSLMYIDLNVVEHHIRALATNSIILKFVDTRGAELLDANIINKINTFKFQNEINSGICYITGKLCTTDTIKNNFVYSSNLIKHGLHSGGYTTSSGDLYKSVINDCEFLTNDNNEVYVHEHEVIHTYGSNKNYSYYNLYVKSPTLYKNGLSNIDNFINLSFTESQFKSCVEPFLINEFKPNHIYDIQLIQNLKISKRININFIIKE